MESRTESDHFWKPLIYTDGVLDEEKVLNELADYLFLMREASKVYCDITGGALSKTNYPAEVVLEKHQEACDRSYGEYYSELAEGA